MVPIQYNYRNLATRKATTIATAGGLALVVFVLAAVLMLSNGIQKTLGRSGSPDRAIVLRKGSDVELASGIEEQQVSLITNSPEVAKGQDGQPRGVGEVVAVALFDKVGTDGFSNVTIRGVPDNVLAFRSEAKIIAGRAATPGTDEAIIGKSLVGRFKGTSLGQSFELRKNRPVQVVGVFADGGSSFESEVWADVHTVRTAFGREGMVSSVRVQLQSPSSFDSFKMAMDQNKQLGLDAMRETDYYEKQSEGTSIFITALGSILAAFVAIGAMVGAMITMYASIANRRREIGVLRALGFSRSSILFSFLFESTLLALIGGVVGALAALPWAFVRFSTMNFASWSEIVFTFEPTPKILIVSVVAAAIMGLLGGFFPALRAARTSSIQAMRN